MCLSAVLTPKLANALQDEHNKAYVADVGLGKLLTEGAEAVAYAASLFWAAPEQLQVYELLFSGFFEPVYVKALQSLHDMQ